jgi:hypothetical protein
MITTPTRLAAIACLALAVFVPTTAAGDAGGGWDSSRDACRVHASTVFWTANDWVLLARELAARQSQCVTYYISIPPTANDKTRLRVAQDELIRALGARFKPVAEATLGTLTGWAPWVAADPSRTWFDAGVEFRKRMVDAGYDFGRGETWLLNEANRSTRRDQPPYPRQAILDMVRGIAVGDGTGPVVPGIVELGIEYSHQTMPDLTELKAETKSLLADSSFWQGLDPYVSFFAREAYADARRWGVAGSSLAERERSLDDYQQHLVRLAADGPARSWAAQDFLDRTFLPLLNGTWPARGPDPFVPLFCCGHGWTMIPLPGMLSLVSEEVYSVRRTSDWEDPIGSPARLGFSWQPVDNFDLGRPAFEAAMRAIAARIGASIRYAYAPGETSAHDACSPPGTTEDFCTGAAVPGAFFTDAWAQIARWDN